MGICPSCKEDNHTRHNSYYHADIMRKGLKMSTTEIACTCWVCVDHPPTPEVAANAILRKQRRERML